MPSPDWRDQIIYFVMIDRFDDGDPHNNDQGAGEYDPSSKAHYSGGDLAGLQRRLDYIRGLGATALWITPPVAHQWWDGSVGYGGYHGYWAEHFAEVDAHFGTLEDYRNLSRALHARGMFLIQDVVVNHVGNFFSYEQLPPVDDPAQGHVRNRLSGPRSAPTQWPFTLNDPRRTADRAAAIYHWTPPIADFSDPVQERTWQLADLDDLATRNPLVRRALRESYGHWIREVGVDAFRVDTAFHVEPEFFDDFLHARDPQAPGIVEVAAQTGRTGFHVFGEGFGIDAPFADVQARKLETWVRSADGKPLLPGMINFPLYGSTLDVFARGRPTAVLGHRIRNMMQVHARPHLMPSFVDNHDVDRFLAGARTQSLEQALLLIHTLPGIPVIYYGTEQGFTTPRAAMFASGHGARGRDHFDTDAPLYRFLQRVTALRRDHKVFSRGIPDVLRDNAAAAGVLAYAMRHEGETALIVFNSAAHETLLAGLETGLRPGTLLQPAFAIGTQSAPQVVGADGRINLRLGAGSGQVWIAAGSTQVPSAGDVRVSLGAPASAAVRGDLALSGRAYGTSRIELVVDGDLARAQSVEVGRRGRWRAMLDTRDFVDADVDHEVVAWAPEGDAVSERRSFRVDRPWHVLAEVEDPADDDHGPRGRYRYPTDASWQGRRTFDILGAQAAVSGGSLRVRIRMRDLLSVWKAPNGFDHLALTVFVELPGRDDGQQTMPLQNALLPAGMRWHYRLRVGGWSNSLFAAAGAGAENEGTPVTPAATLRVERDTLVLLIPAAALGNPASLEGARLLVTSWDYDGGYRPLAAQAGPFVFGGGDGTRDPLVMDDTGIIELRRR